MSTTIPTLRLGAADAGRVVSSDEFAHAEFAEPYRYERVDGRLVVVAPAGEFHIAGTEPWRDYLGMYRLGNPEIVERVVSEAWMRVDDDNDRIGDIGVYLKREAQAPPIPDRVPDLVYEVVSPGRRAHERDYLRKRDAYRQIGVREYVVIDRAASKVTVFDWTKPAAAARTLSRADVYTSSLLPGLAIALGEVL